MKLHLLKTPSLSCTSEMYKIIFKDTDGGLAQKIELAISEGVDDWFAWNIATDEQLAYLIAKNRGLTPLETDIV